MSKYLKLGLLAFVVLGITFLGCDKMAGPTTNQKPDAPGKVKTAFYETNLIAGQTQVVGTVKAYANSEGIFVEYRTTGDWYLTQIHTDVEPECDDGFAFPTNKNGNPQIGQFDYNSDNDPMFEGPYHTWLVTFPWVDLWGSPELCFAAHAVVKKIVNGQVVETQTGWGDGEDGPGGSWWMYFCWYRPLTEKTIKLPKYMVQVQYTQVSGNTPSMFQVAGITPVIPPYCVNNGYYHSFCLDRTVYITPGWKNALLWDVYGPMLPIYIMYNRGTNDLTPYDKISYLADKFMDANDFSYAQIQKYQHVFWYYRGIYDWSLLTPAEQALVQDADTNGDDWYPSEGDWFAVPMDIGCTVQLCFLIADP